MDPIPVRLPAELQARVDRLAVEMSISRSAVVRLAIQQWLDASDHHGVNPMLRETPPGYRFTATPPAKKSRTKRAKD